MCTPQFILLLLSYIYIVGAQQQGDLRFRGLYANGISGRLEVFINNQWGTICVDGFTKRSADTACRQLGSIEALTFGEAERFGYGQGSGQIHITELDCSSDDIHILHCTVRNTVLCAHSSDVAVICAAQPAFEYDGGIRLVDGPHRSEGILELFFFGRWGGVCGRAFDTITADAACIALGYTRSRDAPGRASRFQNMSSPVWITSTGINCQRVGACFDTCYRDPVGANDLSAACVNDFVYLTCEFREDINSRCLASPVNPNPNSGNVGVGGSVSDEDDETDSTAVAIVLPIVFGSIFIILVIVWCISCEGYKWVGSCFKSISDCFCGVSECCCEGCLSIVRFFDIRRCFEDRDNRDTVVNTGRISNLEPRRTANQELEALEMEAMSQPPRTRRTSSSSIDSDRSDRSDHSYKKENNGPPDYRDALKFSNTKPSKKDDDDKPTSDDQPPPPSYDSVV